MNKAWVICIPLLFSFLIVVPGTARAAGPAPAQQDNPEREKNRNGQGQPALQPEYCLSPEEAELAVRINQARKEKGLPAIRINPELTIVAKWHVIDLALNAPHRGRTDGQGKACDLHSWSDRGPEMIAGVRSRNDGNSPFPSITSWKPWKPVCYTADHSRATDMWQKPGEIMGYQGMGYEIVYWSSATLTPERVIRKWMTSATEGDMILESNQWENKRWTSMGIGIRQNFATVWLCDLSVLQNQETPPLPPCEPAKTGSMIVLIPDEEGTVGSALVSTAGGTQPLDRPNAATEVRTRESKPDAPRLLTDREIGEIFGAALKATPPAAVSFVLYFELSKTTLTEESSAKFTEVLDVVKRRSPCRIRLAGYADTLGSAQANELLARRRAMDIQDKLLAAGVPSNMIEVVSTSSKDLPVPTASQVKEPRNRRVEITIQ